VVASLQIKWNTRYVIKCGKMSCKLGLTNGITVIGFGKFIVSSLTRTVLWSGLQCPENVSQRQIFFKESESVATFSLLLFVERKLSTSAISAGLIRFK
jgi:hypothetical protein